MIARSEIPECLRPLSVEEYAVPVPTHEEIRALLRGAGNELRAMVRRDPTPIRGSDAAQGHPPSPPASRRCLGPASISEARAAAIRRSPTRGAENP